jgi:hypothetical protein
MALNQQHGSSDLAAATPISPAGSLSLLASLPWRILSVVRFEFRRTRTPPRLAVWSVLAFFPVVIMAIVRYYGGPQGPIEEEVKLAWGVMFYALVPQVVCLLGLLLWVCPVVHSELEGRTWYYLTSRPDGRIAMLLGKYLNGVAWTATAGWFGATLAVLIAWPSVLDISRLWWTLMMLVGISSFAYGAAYTLISVIFHRRAMMISVAYMLVVEVLMGNMPAIVNQITVHHRMINLLWQNMQWEIPDEIALTLNTTAGWIHLIVLFAYTLLLLIIAIQILRWREYITSDES